MRPIGKPIPALDRVNCVVLSSSRGRSHLPTRIQREGKKRPSLSLGRKKHDETPRRDPGADVDVDGAVLLVRGNQRRGRTRAGETPQIESSTTAICPRIGRDVELPEPVGAGSTMGNRGRSRPRPTHRAISRLAQRRQRHLPRHWRGQPHEHDDRHDDAHREDERFRGLARRKAAPPDDQRTNSLDRGGGGGNRRRDHEVAHLTPYRPRPHSADRGRAWHVLYHGTTAPTAPRHHGTTGGHPRAPPVAVRLAKSLI